MSERIDLPTSSSPRVSVIIPAAAEPELLRSCLRSLAANGPRAIPFETIVVLNADTAVPEAAGVHGVRPAVNLGLAGAGNRGRSLARGEYLVLLHDDAEVEPGWLEALVETAERHPEAGAVGGKVLFPDGRLQNAGMILWRDATTSPCWLGEAPPATAFDRLRAVDYCGTSSLLVRAATWDAAGGLDERFYPAYYVDVSLAMAIRQLGQAVLYDPRSRIRHHQGASGSRAFRVFVTQRNRRLFLETWGAALQEHEPRESSQEAIERAMARAAASAEKGRALGGGPEVRDGGRALDPAVQERRHLEKELALQKDWAAHLAASLDEAAAEAVRAREAVAALERELAASREALARESAALAEERRSRVPAAELAELRARAATLEAIERGRWWRLYQRLLPLLRRLRRG
jgi:GT2 family glycosyltransferase